MKLATMTIVALLAAQLCLADEMSFQVQDSFDMQAFISSCSAQGISLQAEYSSATPHGFAVQEGNKLSVTLYEQAAPSTLVSARAQIWNPGRSVVPDLSSAWSTILGVLGLK